MLLVLMMLIAARKMLTVMRMTVLTTTMMPMYVPCTAVEVCTSISLSGIDTITCAAEYCQYAVVLQYPTFKLFGFIYASSTLKV